ncbi:unnamed protein product [Ceratitis capitata]|uniref:(Mediterranean fruit fly) hypothetical protein n=1 Tax=Ceratitis capitata TaxID=7213 RepID=A0A811VDD4_CERCA|nr:unnamed protein product [Ceratitis capitata]
MSFSRDLEDEVKVNGKLNQPENPPRSCVEAAIEIKSIFSARGVECALAVIWEADDNRLQQGKAMIL